VGSYSARMSGDPSVEELLEQRRWWGGRFTAVQAAWAGAAAALLVFGVAEIIGDRWHVAPWPVSLVFVLLATVPVALVSTRPVPAVATVALAQASDALLFTTPQSLAVMFGALLAAGGAARYAPRRALAPLLGLLTVVIVVAALRDPTDDNPYDYFFTFGICATAAAAGFLVRARHAAVLQAVEIVVQERTKYEVGVERALVEERARIARDLHDVVAHAVSLIVIQSAAGRAVAPRDPARASEVFDTIEAAGQRALADLRRLLDVLHADDRDSSRPPGLSALDELVAQTNAAGLPCRVVWSGESHDLPDGVAVAAYRVVQESVTNALKHGARHGVDIHVTRNEAGVRVDVLDQSGEAAPGGLTGAGRGLQGMRERVGLYDGTLAAGPQQDGWRVEAYFPVAAGA
jgi:signal transduction histidine kinase